ncbi:MAG: HK97 family phage prohead protease [Prevotellaceae bacterium]|nr:HK97 family phage prohead protease [Prevotellaceae bacterium]
MANKTFIANDESLNSYKFWVRTNGIDLSLFKKNPIMLWNHYRSSSWNSNKDEVLPIGVWENIRIEGDKLLADAHFDEKDKFAAEISRKVQENFLNMCSIGIEVIEESQDAPFIKQGQQRSTVTKCLLKEISIVDIGSNRNAIALYDNEGKIIELSDNNECPIARLNDTNSNEKNNNMKLIALKLGLSDAATQDEILSAITKLQDDNKTVVTLQQKIDAAEKETKEKHEAEAGKLIDEAVKAGKIEANGKEAFKTLFANDFDNAKKTLESISAKSNLASQVNHSAGASEKFVKLSWDEMDKKGMLAELKEADVDLYKSKFKEKFGKEPN